MSNVDPVKRAQEICDEIRNRIRRADVSKLCLAVAQDVAGRIRQSIRENRITPPIKPATVARKAKDGATAAGAASVTLMHTGLMHDSVKARLVDKNKAEVTVEPRNYGSYVRVSSVKTRNERWKKHTKSERKKRGGGARPTTTQVARWHNDGEANHSPKREFFKMPNDFAEICYKRFVTWRDAALNRILGT